MSEDTVDKQNTSIHKVLSFYFFFFFYLQRPMRESGHVLFIALVLQGAKRGKMISKLFQLVSV